MKIKSKVKKISDIIVGIVCLAIVLITLIPYLIYAGAVAAFCLGVIIACGILFLLIYSCLFGFAFFSETWKNIKKKFKK